MPFIGPKPADTVLDSTLIADGTITSEKIADGAVQTAKLAANAVQTSQITDANVTTAKIAEIAAEVAATCGSHAKAAANALNALAPEPTPVAMTPAKRRTTARCCLLKFLQLDSSLKVAAVRFLRAASILALLVVEQ